MKYISTIISAAMLASSMALSAKPALKYVSADSLTMVNKAQPGGPRYQRIDVERYPDLTKTVNLYYSFPTGLALVFSTDSRNIHARWTTANDKHAPNSTAINQSGLDLYIKKDGKWVFAGVGRPGYNTGKHKSAIVENMADSVKECLLYLPLFDRLYDLELGIDSTATIKSSANPFNKRVLTIGSSITHGTGTSRPGMTYCARLERDFGIEFINLGASGQCKLDEFFARIAADTQADAFLFDTFSNPTGEQIDARLAEFVRIVREAHPTTPLIFLQTLDRESRNFNQRYESIEAAKQEAARRGLKKLMETDKNIYFIDPGMPIGSDHDATVDGVHPTDLGHDRILSVIAPQIKEILKAHSVAD